MRKAFLEIGNNNSAIYEIARYVLFPRLGILKVNPKPEFGHPSEWNDIDSFISAINDGTIHPFDAKMAISRGLEEVLVPISEYFSDKSEILDAMNLITGSQ